MAIVVEDGTGKTDSNSYISEADFATYASDRGITVTGTASQLLYQAMDYIEQQPYKGYKYTDAQALQWPRGGVWIDGYYVEVTTIPTLLQDALCEVALGIDAGNNPLATQDRLTKREKVGDIEVEYSDASRAAAYLVAAETKLQKLLKVGSGGISAVAIRG